MEKHTGEIYTGYISFVARFGIWVMLENGIEGFIHINNLPKDKYNYSTELLSLIGKTNRFNIGDKLEVKVKGANKEAKTVDFVVSKEYLKNEQKGNPKTKKRVKDN
jgi:ribonuclease R